MTRLAVRISHTEQPRCPRGHGLLLWEADSISYYPPTEQRGELYCPQCGERQPAVRRNGVVEVLPPLETLHLLGNVQQVQQERERHRQNTDRPRGPRPMGHISRRRNAWRVRMTVQRVSRQRHFPTWAEAEACLETWRAEVMAMREGVNDRADA